MTRVESAGVFNTCRGMRMIASVPCGIQLLEGQIITDGNKIYRIMNVYGVGDANNSMWALGIEEI